MKKYIDVKKLIKESRDLLVMCTLLDKSGQCDEMVNRLDEYLKISSENPKKMTKDDLSKYNTFADVGELKKFIDKHKIPDNAPIMVQRVSDFYYEQCGWTVYKKNGEHSHYLIKHNKEIDEGKYNDKEEYPLIKPEDLVKASDEDIEKSMEEYHPIWCLLPLIAIHIKIYENI